ncbi:MAG: dihydrofolate reductase [Hyphomicrobiales bacterium]
MKLNSGLENMEKPGKRSIVFVVAAGENGVIGCTDSSGKAGMPWRMASDLKRFRKLTMGKPLIMGRKTHEAIGRALPGRDNIVVTRNRAFKAEGVLVASSLEAALILANKKAHERNAGEIAVIGGGEVFSALLDRAQRIYLSRIHALPRGNTHLFTIDPAQWREKWREKHEPGPGDDTSVSFIVLDRIGPTP